MLGLRIANQVEASPYCNLSTGSPQIHSSYCCNRGSRQPHSAQLDGSIHSLSLTDIRIQAQTAQSNGKAQGKWLPSLGDVDDMFLPRQGQGFTK